ncbi:MAG: anthranilate phosphoribosyltransferase [Dehalococcoidia bacterium]|nr:anthranilate phosphoribosyltransferase [Dehalococcoidia bacterium]
MIREAIDALVAGRSLSTEEGSAVMEEIMTGEATPAQFGAFVTALRLKGETIDEITGMAQVMREKALRVDFRGPVVDTCGTGGDGAGTFNFSTAAAFVAAGAGLTVAKHGNRAMSSQCGSADVLEALGVKIDLVPEQVKQCLEQVGMGFMFAQTFHPSMRFAAGPRREIGIRTVFNILGPLTNPAGAQYQVLGVADPRFAPKMAQALQRLGSIHALVVHSSDGLDELSLCGTTTVYELADSAIREYLFAPEELGLTRCKLEDIKGGSAQENAEILKQLLTGKSGAIRDMAALNAAAALVAGDKVSGLKDGLAMAYKSIDSGAAMSKVEQLVKLSQSFGS